MTKGILYVVSAPSGTGKSSLIRALLKTQLLHNTQISISYTTRAKRPNEINGEHYFFIDDKEFRGMISKNMFLEHAKVFGNYYGTSREIINQMLATYANVFLDIDWQGAKQIRKKIPNLRSIFILPPSKDELKNRLLIRCQDTEEIIKKRMEKAVLEMSHYVEYDYLIVNDDFNVALNDLKTILHAEGLRMNHQKQRNKKLIIKLLTD